MDTIEVLRGLHRGVRFMFENSVRTVFTPEQMKERPDGRGNSIAWLLWHLARTEDMIVNTVIQGRPQLLETDSWSERLGVDTSFVGTGFGDDEVADLTERMNVEAADEYWNAVAKNSFHWLKSITAEQLDDVPDIDERLAAAPPILSSPNNQGAIQFWSGRSAGTLFSGTVVSHGYIHVGQMQEIGGRLGKVGWF